MILQELLTEVGSYNLKGDLNHEVHGVVIDSRKVEPGFMFAALKGEQVDGHDFIEKAIDLGATCLLVESDQEEREGIVVVQVKDVRKTLGFIASAFYEHPSMKLKCVGVTGTNGKTTVATLLYNLFKELGYKVGLISTIEILVNEKKCDTKLTTPDVITLHDVMNQMVEARCDYVFMEVSSHATIQNRIGGVRFRGGVFTNITHDHLDYHKTFKSYIAAKKLFFDHLENDAFAIVNIDDRNGMTMVQETNAKILKYSLRQLTDFKTKILSESLSGMQLEINGLEFFTRLSGHFNAFNLTAVFAVASVLTEKEDLEIIEKISALKTAKGRLEIISNHPVVIVDFAHTPDALDNVLKTLSVSKENGNIITVVGCGGDRDKLKRPLMSTVALKYSETLILTSDNPRSESPEDILKDMLVGVLEERKNDVFEVVDRKSAIKMALKIAGKNDVVLIAGKGHEEYQEIKGKRHFFSDQQIVKDLISKDI